MSRRDQVYLRDPKNAAAVTNFLGFLKGVPIEKLPPEMQQRISATLAPFHEEVRAEKRRVKFLEYARHVMPNFSQGPHHEVIADAFERMLQGRCKRLIIALPPRGSKSQMSSILLPGWWLGNNPQDYVIQISNIKKLATKFGSEVRKLLLNPRYREIFGEIDLSKDTNSKDVFNTDQGGRYVAQSITGTISGEGANLLIADDLHSEQEFDKAIVTAADLEGTWERFQGGPKTRLMPGGNMVIAATRWSKMDVSGRCWQEKLDGREDWELIEFPAIVDEGKPTERSFWPGVGDPSKRGNMYWPLEELKKKQKSLPVWKWNALYMQKPMDQGANIIHEEWWRDWAKRTEDGQLRFPIFSRVMIVLDSAMSTKETANYSACTTWGVFKAEDEGFQGKGNRLLLCDANRGRWGYPELKAKMLAKYEWACQKWGPDNVLFVIERKNSGSSLVDELTLAGIPVHPFTPQRGEDKSERLQINADLFEQGLVYAPLQERWAKDVIDEVSQFPYGDFDDYADTASMAVRFFRLTGQLFLPREQDQHDLWDREEEARGSRNYEYY